MMVETPVRGAVPLAISFAARRRKIRERGVFWQSHGSLIITSTVIGIGITPISAVGHISFPHINIRRVVSVCSNRSAR